MSTFRIQLAKETFKFSASHFTLLSAESAERLHGHNYQVAVECEITELGPFGMAFEFNTLKPHIKELSAAWDELVLIPEKSPYLFLRDELVGREPHLVVEFNERSYRFPKADTARLATENITSEELARLFATSLAAKWRTSADSKLSNRVRSLRVSIEETRGQCASYVLLDPLGRSAAL